MSVNITIRKFEVDNSTKANYLIIGKFFYTIPVLKDIIKDNRSIIITFKERQKEYNPETCTFYDTYDEFDVKKYIDDIKINAEQIPFYSRPHTYLVFDDCFYDSTWQENHALLELIKDPNNIFNTSVVLGISYPIGISPYMKTSIDYTFVMSNVKRDSKMLYDRYFDFLEPYRVFTETVGKLLNNENDCVVILEKEFKKTFDCIQWYGIKQ